MIVKIISTDGIVFENHKVSSIQIPSSTGIINVYSDHKPLIVDVFPGEVSVEIENEQPSVLAISSGILMIEKDSKVSLLVETAERDEEIDIQKAEESKKRAEELLSKKEEMDEREVMKLEAKILKEIARIQVGKRKFKN